MKFKTILALVLALAAVPALAGCANSAAKPQNSEEDTPVLDVYRGRVDEVTENGSLLVTQLEGHNYGQESVLFYINEDAIKEDIPEGGIEQGAYVEVHYSGILTRSLPPQGVAESLRYIAPFSEGIVVNGTIQNVKETDDGYTIDLLPLEAQNASYENQIILHVPKYAVEGFAAKELAAGMKVSAVTHGIAAMSLPPQMSVDTLLPYTT